MPEFPCDGPITLALTMRHGNVDVVAEHRSTAFAEVTSVDGLLEEADIEMHDGVLVVRVPDTIGHRRGWRPSRLRVVARIPTGSGIDADVRSGDLRGRGTFGRFQMTSSSGDLVLDHVTGEASVRSASGDLRIDRVDGSLAANTASGDIDIRHVGGDLRVHSSSGDLTLGLVAGSVDATTASGDVGLAVVSAGTVEVRSASGDVTVGVAEGTAVWLDLATTSGDTRNELALHDDAGGRLGDPPTPVHAPLTLKVRTISGDIKVRRVAAALAA